MSTDNFYKNSLVNDFIAKAYDQCIPLFTTIEINQNCQFRCYHCYNFDRTQFNSPPDQDKALKDSEILQAIEELKNLGALWLNLSGGEPLLHSSLNLFIKSAKEKHFLVRLKTNGELLDSNKIKELHDLGLDAMDISLYGFSEESYQIFTGKAVFGRVRQNILELKKFKEIDFNISLILHKDNIKEFPKMVDFCEENSLPYQISDELTARYDGTDSSQDKALSKDQYEALLLSDLGQHFYYENKEKALQCGCARVVLGIGFTGNVFPCIGAPILSGNLRENSLQNIWKNSVEFAKIRNLKREDFKDCQSCEAIEYCNRSSGATYANTGNYTGCDEETLTHAKLRKKHHKKFNNE